MNMAFFSRFGGLSALTAVGLGLGLAYRKNNRNNERERKWLDYRRLSLKAESTSAENYLPSPTRIFDPHGMQFKRSKWDWNWDGRHENEEVINKEEKVKVNKEGDEGASNDDEQRIKSSSPSASRHLLLIRHGQYNLKGQTDDEKKLTDLGRKQAKATGKRLAQLDLPFTALIQSNMTRLVSTHC